MASENCKQSDLWDTGEPLRRCNKCGQWKPFDQFGIHRHRHSGRVYRKHACRPCESKHSMQYAIERIGEPEFRKRRLAAAQRYYRRRKEADPKYHRKFSLSIYGLSRADYAAMLAAQGGVCAICGIPENRAKNQCLEVDHCHKTEAERGMSEAVRGLLCNSCNVCLGRFRDDPQLLRAAIAYLEAFAKRQAQSG